MISRDGRIYAHVERETTKECRGGDEREEMTGQESREGEKGVGGVGSKEECDRVDGGAGGRV